MVLDELRSTVDQVCSTEPAAICDGESIVELHRCLARLEAATTRATATPTGPRTRSRPRVIPGGAPVAGL